MKTLHLMLGLDVHPRLFADLSAAVSAREALIAAHRPVGFYATRNGRRLSLAELLDHVSISTVQLHERADLVPGVEYYPVAPDGTALLGVVDENHEGGFAPVVSVRVDHHGNLVNATPRTQVGDIAGRNWITSDEVEIPESDLLFSGFGG